MATCRCVMCGAKNAGRVGRGAYVKAGVGTDEKPSKGKDKRRERKLRRVRENRNMSGE